jgi:UDP-galactopyranose mutase
LPASIIARLPVRHSYHDAYFNNRYQGIPLEVYAPIFERMLNGIPFELGVDFLDDREVWEKKAPHGIVNPGKRPRQRALSPETIARVMGDTSNDPPVSF